MKKFPAITGATPIDDISGLRLDINSWDELIEAEANNIAKAYTKYLTAKPSKRSAVFDTQWSLKLHKQMFGEVWDWAGVLRKTQTNIGVAPYQIRTELKKLFDDLQLWKETKMDMLEQAVRLHHRAVKIHPFTNGNGRWSRLLANIWLKQNEYNLTMWPSDMVREGVIRAEYIKAVKQADNGDIGLLIELHRKYTHN